MKRKFLAKAITLGLMLAVPLSAYAEDKNIGTKIDRDYTYTQADADSENNITGVRINITSNDSKHSINADNLTLNLDYFFYGADNELSVTAAKINLYDKLAVYQGKVTVNASDSIDINVNKQNAIRVGNTSDTTIGDLILKAKDVRLKATGDGIQGDVVGISVGNGSKLTITADTTSIDVSNAKGLKAIVGPANIFSDEINITADNSSVSETGNSHVIFGNINLAGKDSTAGNLTSANTIKITTRNVANAIIASSHEMNIKAENLIIDSDTNAFQAIQENSKVTFDVKNADIKGDILALKGGNVKFGSEENPTKNVTIKGKIFTQKYGDVSSETKIDIHNNGKLVIEGDIDTTSREGGTININQGKNDNGILQITGDILTGEVEDDQYTNDSSSINIKFSGEESFLKGNIIDNNQKDGSTITTGGTNISLSDGATWTTKGNSIVKEVKSDGGVIVVNGDRQNVEIKNLKGTDTTIKTDSTDSKLTIGSNSTNITVEKNGLNSDNIGSDINGTMKKVLDVVNVTGENKGSVTAVAKAGVVGGDITATKNGDNVIVHEAVNTDNEAISNMASISLMTWRQENNDMNKRLGELRDSKGEHGAWARMARGESKYGAQNVKNQYNYYQVGYDEKLSTNPNWTVGVALTRTEGNSTFTNGSAENKHTGVAVYGSYLKDDGSFIDLIAKYARMKNEFTINGGAGNGDYETNGYSISAEYGKRFTKDNGFWVEPQVELTYGYVGAASFLSSNGANVRQDGMDSLVGRVGFSLGRDIKAGNVYARASYLYDFDGETDVTFSKGVAVRGYKQDLGGSWWEVGVGTNINLSDATHLYFDVEKTYGGNVATPWQWNAGVRWSF